MRIVGLPDFSAAVIRRDTAVSAATKTTPVKGSAPEAQEAEPQVRAPRISAGNEAVVDRDRVDQIRKALETGTYPLIPTKIADAMIAAGMYGKIDK